MRRAKVFMHGTPAGLLTERDNRTYVFEYFPEYQGYPVSLTMPTSQQTYIYEHFPPFFEGLLPEGIMLEGLLRARKLDKRDYLGQLVATGEDLVGAVTVQADE